MKAGRPRTVVDRPCEYCGQAFRPSKATGRFCSHACDANARRMARIPVRPRYAYGGRLSDELQREIHAARAEQATAPLYRPGGGL
jgi:hypothetical protein